MAGTQKPDPVTTKQQRLAELATQSPQLGFISLNHYLDLPWMFRACNRTRGDGAPGVDGLSGDDYGVNLVANLQSLLDRLLALTRRGLERFVFTLRLVGPILGAILVQGATFCSHLYPARKS